MTNADEICKSFVGVLLASWKYS